MTEHKNIMLDLETMSTEPNAAIVSIGAVSFRLDKGGRVEGATFYQNVKLESSIENGGHMSGGTVDWWMQQSEEARLALFKDRVNIQTALCRFSQWVGRFGYDNVRVWGNGAAFDNVVLKSAYKNYSIPCPWKYTNDMCYRTVKNIRPGVVEDKREGTFHNALDDAKHQAKHLVKILREQ